MRYLFFVVVAIMFFSCEKEIDMTFPEKDRRITINAEIKSDSIVQVHLSKSIGVLELDKNADSIADAAVFLYENNVLLEQLHYVDSGYYRSSTKAKPNAIYKLQVNHKTYPTASAQTRIPSKVMITKIDTVTKKVDDQMNSYMALHHKITFTDPADEDNYYALTVYGSYMEYIYDDWYYMVKDSIKRTEKQYITSTDMVLEDGVGSDNVLLFTDNLINGRTYSLECMINSYYGWGSTYQFHLKSISKDLYLYLMSKQKSGYTKNNPFAEPVTVYNNITNGFGILGASTVSIKEF